MSAHVTVTMTCDVCNGSIHTARRTVAGARGDAERKGWRVTHLADGRHTKVSSDPKRRDVCPNCLVDVTKPEGLLL